MKLNHFKLTAVLCAVLFVCTSAFAQEHDCLDDGFCIIDSHLHYSDFLQGSDGFDKLLESMDKNRVVNAVIFGTPLLKEWSDASQTEPSKYVSPDARCYYNTAADYILLNDLAAQSDEAKSKFYVFVSGINPTDRMAAVYLKKLIDTYKDNIYGIGEITCRDGDLSPLTYGTMPKANSEAMKAIYDLAAEYELPVMLHNDLGAAYTKEPIYLDEMKEALEYNPKTNIIWSHLGVSPRCKVDNIDELAQELLDAYENLYCDISGELYDDVIGVGEDSLNKWAEILEKYPDRFIIGSDLMGDFTRYNHEITKYYPLVARLTPETRVSVCKNNILKLIGVMESDKPAKDDNAQAEPDEQAEEEIVEE